MFSPSSVLPQSSFTFHLAGFTFFPSIISCAFLSFHILSFIIFLSFSLPFLSSLPHQFFLRQSLFFHFAVSTFFPSIIPCAFLPFHILLSSHFTPSLCLFIFSLSLSLNQSLFFASQPLLSSLLSFHARSFPSTSFLHHTSLLCSVFLSSFFLFIYLSTGSNSPSSNPYFPLYNPYFLLHYFLRITSLFDVLFITLSSFALSSYLLSFQFSLKQDVFFTS